MNYQSAVTDVPYVPYVRKHYLLREEFDKFIARNLARCERTHPNSVTAFTNSRSTYTNSNTAIAQPGSIPTSFVSDRGERLLYALVLDTEAEPLVDVVAPFGIRRVDSESNTVSPAVVERTISDLHARAITRTLNVLVEGARDEYFEDGVESNLSAGLRILFRNYAESFARILDERLKKSDIGPWILTAVLHTIGNIDDDATRDWRLATLVGHLKAPSPLIRDAAAVGLSYLDDKRAIPYLREAIARETNKDFQEDLSSVVEQLGI